MKQTDHARHFDEPLRYNMADVATRIGNEMIIVWTISHIVAGYLESHRDIPEAALRQGSKALTAA